MDGENSPPRVRHGAAIVDGTVHRMRVAKPSSVTARLYGLNPNHHVRVWCDCMDESRRPRIDPGAVEAAGLLPGGVYDPRRLGAFDWLGLADVRVPGSALSLFRAHIQEVASRAAQR